MDRHAAYEEARSVRKGDPAAITAMAEALARAFYDDPVFSWVLRHDKRRMKILRRGFALFLRQVWLDHEETWTTAGAVGAAVWEQGLGTQVALLPSILGVFGRHSPRVLRAITMLERDHPAEPRHAPHYYLAFLGVDPAWQGRGLGAALLAPVLERCDSERLPAYLEASTPRNRALYERHRFEVTEEFKLGGTAPIQWRMWREPQ